MKEAINMIEVLNKVVQFWDSIKESIIDEYFRWEDSELVEDGTSLALIILSFLICFAISSWGSGFVRKISEFCSFEESKEILESVIAESVANGDNLVYPIVGGGNAAKLAKKIEYFKKNGYTVFLHLNELSSNKAMDRMLGRFISTGRLIDPKIRLLIPTIIVWGFAILPTVVNFGNLIDLILVGYTFVSKGHNIYTVIIVLLCCGAFCIGLMLWEFFSPVYKLKEEKIKGIGNMTIKIRGLEEKIKTYEQE